MKNSPEKVSEDVSWNHFFRIREKFFQKICTYFLSLLYMRSLAYKIFIVFLQIIIQNYDV